MKKKHKLVFFMFICLIMMTIADIVLSSPFLSLAFLTLGTIALLFAGVENAKDE